jgi:hypothetical protein
MKMFKALMFVLYLLGVASFTGHTAQVLLDKEQSQSKVIVGNLIKL